ATRKKSSEAPLFSCRDPLLVIVAKRKTLYLHNNHFKRKSPYLFLLLVERKRGEGKNGLPAEDPQFEDKRGAMLTSETRMVSFLMEIS
ncbi:MAG: hypothetical protein IK129_01745, partial [Deltaproteobacteria bacterium]|nr:hypothetical protein [Deltaproteobacteria bacterium]